MTSKCYKIDTQTNISPSAKCHHFATFQTNLKNKLGLRVDVKNISVNLYVSNIIFPVEKLIYLLLGEKRETWNENITIICTCVVSYLIEI